VTALTEAPGSVEPRLEPRPVAPVAAPGRGAGHPDASSTEFTPEGYGRLVLTWVVITVVGVAIVLANLGRVTEERDQRALLADYRAEIESASNQAFGLAGSPPQRREPGRPSHRRHRGDRPAAGGGRHRTPGTRQGPVTCWARRGRSSRQQRDRRTPLFGGAFGGLGEGGEG
jgi:hypothetical protein